MVHSVGMPVVWASASVSSVGHQHMEQLRCLRGESVLPGNLGKENAVRSSWVRPRQAVLEQTWLYMTSNIQADKCPYLDSSSAGHDGVCLEVSPQSLSLSVGG